MKNKKLTLILLSSLSCFSPIVAQAQLAVVDAGTASQIGKLISTTNHVIKAIDISTDKLQDIYNNLSGNNYFDAGIDSEIAKIKTDLSSIMPDIVHMNNTGFSIDRSNRENFVKHFDQVFQSSYKVPSYLSEESRNEYRQIAYKEAILNSVDTLNHSKEYLKKLQKLQELASKTETMKEEQQLTNKYLELMSLIMIDLGNSISYLSKTQALAKYIGSEDTENKGKKSNSYFSFGSKSSDDSDKVTLPGGIKISKETYENRKSADKKLMDSIDETNEYFRNKYKKWAN
jgi:hypothetical protein